MSQTVDCVLVSIHIRNPPPGAWLAPAQHCEVSVSTDSSNVQTVSEPSLGDELREASRE